MANPSIRFDITEVKRNLKKLDDEIRNQVLVEAMGKAGMQLLNDATMQIPATPLDEGTLRGSGSVLVATEKQTKLVGVSPDPTGGKGTPCRNHSETTKNIVAVVGYNTPYAARLHEHPEYHFGSTSARKGRTPPTGTGAFYLLKKMQANAASYFQIIADVVKGYLR